MAEWVFRPNDTLRIISLVSNFIGRLPDKEYVLEIKVRKKKRSLDANAYAWVLIDKIADKMSLDKVSVYREYIKNIGGVSETVCIKKEAADNLIKAWQAHGIGWQTDTFPSKIDGCVNITLYYGSSTYDTKQMSTLIDQIIWDADKMGIDTLTPNEKLSLISRWDK